MKQNNTILYRRWYRNTHRHINKQQRRHLKGYFRASVRDCTFVLLQVHLGPIESLSYSCWTTYLWRFIWRMSMGPSASLSDIKHVLCQKGCLLSVFFLCLWILFREWHLCLKNVTGCLDGRIEMAEDKSSWGENNQQSWRQRHVLVPCWSWFLLWRWEENDSAPTCQW